MNSFRIENLKPDLYFTNELFLDRSFLLLGAYAPITRELINELAVWGFSEVQSEGTLGTILGSESAPESTPSQTEEVTEENIESATPEKKVNESLKKALEAVQSQGNENSRVVAVQNVYNEYMSYINNVYTRFATHNELNLEELSETVKELCVFVKENKRYVLRIQPSQELRNKNFLVSHSMRSTVLAITIALRLHMPFTKLVELGVACILHEIGMLKLPPQLYITDRILSVAEKTKIRTQPLLGYKILNDAKFPMSIQRAVLEHHERENGTGYPRHLTTDSISSYAKIIAVACSFEAISAPRQYREAHSTYEAMVEMLKNQNQQYDDSVIKALLYSLSLFPIGAYVYLVNGKIAQVTDVNPDNPKNPIVQLVGEEAADGDPRTVQTDEGTNKIVRVMNKQEAEDALKALGLKAK